MTAGTHPAHTYAPHTHAAGPPGAGLEASLPLAVLAAAAVLYVVLARRRTREPLGWNPWRTVSFLAGTGILGAALAPGLSPFPDGSFAGHMHQHLLIGMYAPLGLVLGAPVTLMLRSLPRHRGRILGRALRSTPLRVLAHPLTGLVLNLGGLALLYLTPLYTATTQHPALHHLVHLHFLAAGYLFAYSIAGPDPAPHRPSVPVRLVVLGVAVAGHAVLAQFLYAGALPHVAVPPADLRTGADLMYYGGDIAELLLAFAMVSTWRPRRRAPAPGRPGFPAPRPGSAGTGIPGTPKTP
ncbi:membrane protein [Zafaria cholistanensis]|uniref:Membrane protein n=1 Tax=Zafaria cholistanensis TaxID=1682741 RepID=A0A5A7NND5_9MICC|nr:cytochrome c oxidase assembly protein [Zafaria cholistanensis]GER22395.1 membrane protein [Zafaria cholistanensis]